MAAGLERFELGPFVPGVDNRRPETKMRGKPEDGGDFLRFAVNADISEVGNITRRAGYAQALAGSDCHSVWTEGADTFMVDGRSLRRIKGLPSLAAATTLRADLTLGRHVSYARANRVVYYSNGVEIGRVTAAGASPVCTPGPSLPVVTSGSGGALKAGRYGLCFSHLDAAGEESAATAPTWVDAADGSTITVTGLATAAPTGAVSRVVYMTAPNDSVMQRALVTTTFAASLAFSTMPALGARCATMLLSPMPAGDIVRHHGARLLTASGSVLTYSEPYMLGLTNPTRNYLPFPATITVVQPTPGGLWVCADQTYWLAGLDLAKSNLESRAPFGGVTGSGGATPDENTAFWMSQQGLVRGSAAGELAFVQDKHVAVAQAGFAAGFYREFDGRRQFGEALFAVEPNRMAAASYMDAEVIRKKVTL